VVGTLLLLGGNGGVVLAQQYITSSMTALLVATEPLWVVVLSWFWLKSGRPNWKVFAGLLIGFAGVWFLISGRDAAGFGGDGSGQLFGFVSVMGGALFWAAGSIYGLRATTPRSSLLTAGMQMLSGSLALFVVGIIRGEWASFDPSAVSQNSVLALFYLLIFGSLLGFTAYSWLLKNAQPSMVATYAYVNPVIAVLLGWSIAGESLTSQMLIGAVIIVVSVALITASKKSGADEAADVEIHESNTPAGTSKPVSVSA
jgi:drug/metabolite transporter (DMT)-like permease